MYLICITLRAAPHATATGSEASAAADSWLNRIPRRKGMLCKSRYPFCADTSLAGSNRADMKTPGSCLPGG
jgi:hypothetical protein